MLETIKGRIAHRRKGDEGFTLIELLVVIVILAILAAIVVFAVGGIGNKGQESACETDLQTIQTAQEAFFANQDPVGGYAASTDTLRTAGFLTDPSTLHSTGLIAGGAYEIQPIGTTCTNSYVSVAPQAN